MHAVHSTAICTDSGIFRCSEVWRTPKRHSPRVARRRTAAGYGAAESAVGRQSATKKPGRVSPSGLGKTIDGGPSGIRTLDLGIKSPLLWPAELTAHRLHGVGKGARTLDLRSHSPSLCQLSYSHQVLQPGNNDVTAFKTQASTSSTDFLHDCTPARSAHAGHEEIYALLASSLLVRIASMPVSPVWMRMASSTG